MLIKKIKLSNIRSYRETEINFPTGSVLLNGDVGAGKSTILLAIEFALFGLRRSDLSGATLLRSGEKFGYVELNFEIDNKDIKIKRSLARTKKTISQDSGYIEINGNRKDLSIVELKQEIINLLNYPKEFLTKTKDLIYRYTVYTPQEQMKQILLENPQERLNILRRVFGIEKYKTIINNAKLFVSQIKEKTKELSGVVIDLEQKKQEEINLQEKIIKIKEDIKPLEINYKNISLKIDEKRNEIILVEDKIVKINEVKTNLSVKSIQLENINTQIQRNKKDLELIKEELKNTEPLQLIDANILLNETQGKTKELEEIEKKLEAIKNTLRTNEIKIINTNEIKNKFNNLNLCPTCQQIVQPEHKQNLCLEQDNIINKTQENLDYLKLSIREKEDIKEKLKINLEELREKHRKIELNNLKYKNFNEKRNKELVLQKEILDLEENRKKTNQIIEELKQENLKFKIISETYPKLKVELDNLRENLKKIEIEKSGLEREALTNGNFIKRLQEEITKKEIVKTNIQKLTTTRYFFEKEFISLIEIIERKIMIKAFSDFNKLFQDWFNILINNELLKIRIDQEFTPIIEQNGYETDYLNLSGGEKTAAALAYRLALNQVINNLMSSIKTREIIILDEPTDGFSEAQLDRLKLVLEELKIKQVILVSHESKIESFVDNIIKLNKKEHVSEIIE
jgi:DNA repair protein SbcC/Rad50